MQGNGTFTLHALATDVDGHQTWLGTRAFTSDNANATKPFGTIDTPGMATGCVGHRVSELRVDADAAAEGRAVRWIDDRRPHRRRRRREARGTSPTVRHPGALPWLREHRQRRRRVRLRHDAYADGLHTISWVVTDSAGITEGIGSRFFIIDNAAAPAAVQASVEAPLGAGSRSPSVDAGRVGARAQGLRRSRTARSRAVPWRTASGRRTTSSSASRFGWRRTGDAPQGSRYEGYLVVGDERRALPIGSTLDASTGRFYWQPTAWLHRQV